ncbi:diguanylate cyclase (GGDEF) domain-containing protein [Methylophilus rhizosphaerae]|uniref:diguanylate cyclase n=1 Tax=Methylophilus rhizosphaerae TaxID=492660 RepID=A0A1G9E220_9PROT|nr:GGDEF domain-containing protein [Methylophilus rhizosphaerae]SDK70206.1 diguanylate cyclase (GGDEF) domain-containing protein [Methylophilus rhizosphaerae]
MALLKCPDNIDAEHMTIHLNLSKFMQSLTDLTRIRESLALDPALLSLLQHWLNIFAAQHQPVRMQVLSRRQLVSAINTFEESHQSPELEGWAPEIYAMLLPYMDKESRHYECLETDGGKLHVFPLQQSVTHKHAILLIQHEALTSEAVGLIEQCLEMFHHYANLIIENERDALTGLLNRKTFDECVSKILLNDYRPEFKFPLHHFLAIFDIDFFKKVNDTYGHLIGDEVLLLFSHLMRETFRDGDLLFRFGGEEFVGVFSCADESDIVDLLERFRTILNAYIFPQVGRITMSVGFARMALNVLPNTVLERADEALYYAKEHGRDRICSYEELVEGGHLQDSMIEGEIELF